MTNTPDFQSGIPLDQLSDGQPLTGLYGDDEVTLVRQGSSIFAVAARCTHLGADLGDGLVEKGTIRCPFHHARFDLQTGDAVSAPAVSPLGCYTTEIADGVVRVSGKISGDTMRAPAREAQPRVVVVGAGAAGHAVADHFTSAGAGARVTLISAEAEAPYERTYVSKQVLAGASTPEDATLPFAHPQNPHPDLRTGVRVEEIDTSAKQVKLSDGEVLAYDTLVLATGATARRPSFTGADRSEVYSLRTMEDARRLRAAASKAKSVAILGASFIGLEAAGALAGDGREIHVISREDVPMEGLLGPDVGGFVAQQHKDNGVSFHMGREISAFDGQTVCLDNGHELAADLVVIGIGVRPALDLATQAGLTLAEGDDGVLVNGQFQTSDASIYAVGDIANYPAPDGSGRRRIEHWAHAADQGRHLARVLLGETGDAFDRVPFFWTKQGDAQLRYTGYGTAQDGARIDGDLAAKDFAVHYNGALLTCNRDLAALEAERDWEAALG
ncbi:Rieske 2Fe-2S domain-containing protein [Rhodobacteraceae bacterium]|nr:Rieske 2Fe-2S domain-containing protein [Paracoccaceae bacterium]